MKKCLAALLVMFCLGPAFAIDVFDEADRLNKEENHDAVIELLTTHVKSVSSGSGRAECYWRLARVQLFLGETAEDRGAEEEELLGHFAEGERLGQMAIDSDPSNHLAYYWKSTNIGRAAQIRGVLNSLFSAKTMKDLLRTAVELNPEHADSFYVLGQLYEQVPGSISFGNKDFAVSLGRISLLFHEKELASGMEEEIDYDYYTESAKHLLARNWNESRRNKALENKQNSYDKAKDALERSFYYEGTVELKSLSDREEALELLRWVIHGLEAVPDRSENQNKDLTEAREILAENQ